MLKKTERQQQAIHFLKYPHKQQKKITLCKVRSYYTRKIGVGLYM
jgi:hypothetical protein